MKYFKYKQFIEIMNSLFNGIDIGNMVSDNSTYTSVQIKIPIMSDSRKK